MAQLVRARVDKLWHWGFQWQRTVMTIEVQRERDRHQGGMAIETKVLCNFAHFVATTTTCWKSLLALVAGPTKRPMSFWAMQRQRPVTCITVSTALNRIGNIVGAQWISGWINNAVGKCWKLRGVRRNSMFVAVNSRGTGVQKYMVYSGNNWEKQGDQD